MLSKLFGFTLFSMDKKKLQSEIFEHRRIFYGFQHRCCDHFEFHLLTFTYLTFNLLSRQSL